MAMLYVPTAIRREIDRAKERSLSSYCLVRIDFDSGAHASRASEWFSFAFATSVSRYVSGWRQLQCSHT
jgi:hypothetical protein